MKTLRLVKVIPWLMAMSFISMLFTIFLIYTVFEAETAAIDTELTSLETQLQTEPEPDEIEEGLRSILIQLQTQVSLTEVLYERMQTEFLNWPQIMVMLNNYDHTQMTVDGIAQNNFQLVVNGKATEEQHVLLYQELLEATGLFLDVRVERISVNMADETNPVEYRIAIDLIQSGGNRQND